MRSTWLGNKLLGLLLATVVACDTVENPSPRIAAVNPSVVSTRGSTQAVISGSSFFARVRSELGNQAPEIERRFSVMIGAIALADEDVRFVDTETISIILPTGLPLGAADVTVVTPAGEATTLAGALTVVNDASGLLLSIEDAPSGGQLIRDRVIRAGDGLTAYAVFRDARGVVVDGDAVSWTVEGDIGVLGTTRATLNTFDARRAGAGVLRAIADTGQTAKTGAILVRSTLLARVHIEDLPGGTGAEIGTLGLTTDDVPMFYAVGRDIYGNFVSDESVTWELRGGIGVLPVGPSSDTMLELTSIGTGQLVAHHDVLPDDVTGNLVVSAGEPVVTRVETTPGGTGTPVTGTTVTAGAMMTVYAIGYDAKGNYAGDVPVTWSVTGGTGAMNPTGPSAQSTFHALAIGIGQIYAEPSAALAGHTEDITVVGGALARFVIETNPNGLGVEVGDDTVSADTTRTYYAVGRDAGGNFVQNETVAWRWDTGCPDLGGLGSATGSSVSFTAGRIGACRLAADHVSLDGDLTGTVTVTSGGLARVAIESAPDGSGVEVGALQLTAGGPSCASTCTVTCGACVLYAVGRDSDGNFAGLESVAWNVFGNIGVVSPSTGVSTTFTAAGAGSGQVAVDRASFGGSPDDYTGAVTVAAGALHHIVIEDAPTGSGHVIDAITLAAGQTLSLHAVGRDVYENFVGVQAVTWTRTGTLAGAFSGNPTSSVVLTATAGVGTVVAGHLTAVDGATGTITVTTGVIDHVVIETAGDGTGAALGAATLAAGQALTGYAVGRNVANAFVSAVSVSWSVSGTIGTLSTATGTSTTLTATTVGSGTLTGTHVSFGSDATGAIQVDAGPLYQVGIEATAGASVDPVTDVTRTAGQTLSLFAVGRDFYGNFVGTQDVSWFVFGGIGTLSNASGPSTTLTAKTVGSGYVRADHVSARDDDTGTIQVLAGAQTLLRIESAIGGAAEVTASTLTAGQTLSVFAAARDAYDNFIQNVSVTWSVTGGIGSVVAGPSTSSTFTATTSGSGTVIADDGSGGNAISGTCTVGPGALHHVVIETAADGSGTSVGTDTLPIGQTRSWYAIGCDAYGNFRSSASVAWSVLGTIGTVTPTSGSNTTFAATTAGGGSVRATHATVGNDDTGTITVTPSICGNGVADPGEVCDGSDLRGETCFSRAYRPGAGSLRCNSACSAYVTTNCSNGPINTVATLTAAISEAYALPGHEVVAIQAGTYALSSTITLNECVPSCAAGEPYGITLHPLSGAVDLTRSTSGTALRVVTGENVIENLSFYETAIGIDLAAGTNAGDNLIVGNLVWNAGITIDKAFNVASDGNVIEANAVMNYRSTNAASAVNVSGDNSTISMNIIYGRYSTAIALTGVAGVNFIDQNSVWLTGTGNNKGIELKSSVGICYRNNIVYGSGSSTGIALTSSSLSTSCGGSAAQNNVAKNHATTCSGSACATLCTGGGGMCDRNVSPGFTQSTMCLPASNALIDSGTSLGYDMWDDSSALYKGAAPDVGARESGVSRIFGAYVSSCD